VAVLRSGEWQVFLHYGQLHQSHAQAEALNYEAFYRNTDITHDPGTVGYGSPLHAGFYRTALAHNVPLIDGEGQARWNPGELVSFAPSHVVAKQPTYRPNVSAVRDLKIDGKRLIDVLTVDSTQSNRIGFVLHLQGRVQRPSGPATASPELKFWREVRTTPHEDAVTLPVQFAGQRMKVTISTPGLFTLTVGSSPDVPPAMRDSLYVEAPGPHAVFSTVIEP
jgi:oligo-alginate lyase